MFRLSDKNSFPEKDKMVAKGVYGNRGFSLIELMVVVAIVALLSFGATTAWNVVVGNGHITSAAESFQQAVYQARALALSRGRRVTLIIDPFSEYKVVLSSETATTLLSVNNAVADQIAVLDNQGNISQPGDKIEINFSASGMLIGMTDTSIKVEVSNGACRSTAGVYACKLLNVDLTGTVTLSTY